MEREEHVLDVRHLSSRFGSIGVLRDLTFHVPAGATLAILGPSGAGKTVLFKALIGAVLYEGEIRWKPATRIGYVPQRLDLKRDVPITGVDYLRARARWTRESDVDISRTLDLVGVSMDVGATRWPPVRRPVPAPPRRIRAGWEPERDAARRADSRRGRTGARAVERTRPPSAAGHGLTVLFISHELTVVYRYATNVLCLSRARACIGPLKTILTPDLFHEMYRTPVDYHVHDH